MPSNYYVFKDDIFFIFVESAVTIGVRKILTVSWLVKALTKSAIPYKSGTGNGNDLNEVM